ncbi:dienelactone hydrolase family protein (plasmid) [Rhodococcus erythropolis]|uniref:dienelactone hydrolase family protein n=1 Tax=Rhodococcus TaxID=1827 RepID=UPI001246197F|nr:MULTISPECIES: dienelactone hydrolase family protein [Rhodococcus]MCJ0949860.1 dienelactone hydrolase family protein [Rhodococcus sp. ARC_M8]MCQ4152144.1 dienelactone hydrolase family protein [Rhodococcus qingshengii]MDJ0441270.1 dienelactone hydrolase family protein [Rhodococcus qingshengii]QEX08474.1 dienelactone hydrolase family protein [Rhodococcus erythropolis]
MSTAVPMITPTYTDVTAVGGVWQIAQINLPGTPRGAVILLCEPDGLGDQSVELMNRLAEHGYESLAANVTAIDPELLSDDRALAVLRAFVAHLGARGWREEQIGVVGYGFGGRIALRAAADLDLGAAISVSPVGMTRGNCVRPALLHAARPVSTPWLGMFGADDEAAPAEAVRLLAERLTDPSPAYTQLVTYPGVDGDFFRESADALGHAAMFDSWQRIIEWFNLRVVPRSSPYAEIWSLKEAMSD